MLLDSKAVMEKGMTRSGVQSLGSNSQLWSSNRVSMSVLFVEIKSLTLLSIQSALPFETLLSVLSSCAPEIL